MARKRKLQLRCPNCKQPVSSGAENFPFCSERCRLIDLGKWASDAYVITSPVQDISDALDQGDAKDSEDD